MSLSNSLKATPLRSTGGTILPGAEFGNQQAKIPAAEASSDATATTASTTVLPLTDEEKAALRYSSLGLSITKYPGAYGRLAGQYGPLSAGAGQWWGGV